MAIYSYSLLLVTATAYYTNSIMESSNRSLQISTFWQGQYLVSRFMKTVSGSMQTMDQVGKCGRAMGTHYGGKPTFLHKSKKVMK